MTWWQHSFPDATLDPGEERAVEVELRGVPFRADRLVMAGWMDEVRGHFKIRYSRLPLLDRESVVAYSNVTRVMSRRRTTVEYRDTAANSFVRSYLPTSVVYVPTDPLSYVSLRQIRVGKVPAMPATARPSALYFGPGVLGNMLRLPSTDERIQIVLKNLGDIPVRVFATVFGVSYAPAPRGEGVSP